MGLTFLALQVHEYLHLGFTPSNDAFASGFFSLTGLHGFHVFVGATLLSIALLRSIRGHYSAGQHIGLEVTGPLLALRRRRVDRALHRRLPSLGEAVGD